ncbi:MAG: TonB-dependent receptor, partial [Gemmatimonadota bacterium]|nr:TonB-dependent receptor [Gemmatimonadota bacterium]
LYSSRIVFRQGDARVTDVALWMNGALPAFSNGAQVYAFGGLGRRKGQGAGNWRLPNGNNTVRAIYPDGFLPMINSTIPDYSGVVGVKGNLMGWGYDLSGSDGYNRFDFDITNTLNASLGAASPRQFYAGSLKFNQATGNFDLVRGFPIAAFYSPLNVAIGVEGRRDAYGIVAGEPNSYINGGVRVLDGPNTGALTTPGAQVFAGFQPTDAGDHSRTNYAGYVDLETSLLERLLVGVAARTEHYSDFGSTTTGKATTRIELFPGFALRGAVASGFRAPSLAQEFFSSTATNFLNLGAGLVPVEVRTLPVSSGPAKALGALPLKAEKSRNTSFGATLSPLSNLSITADFYHIDITDRIVLSGNFTGTAMTAFLAAQGFPGVGSARYFTNAIDTKTKGIDIVGRYAVDLQQAGITRFTVGYNGTGTHVTRVASTPTALAAQQSILFDRLERSRIEEGQPRRSLSLTMDNTFSRINTTVHTTRFGEVGSRGATNPALDQKYGAKWLTDANIGIKLVQNLKATFGVNNIFDVYPDENIPANNNSGILPYSGISPFGFNGRFIYMRMRWDR